MKVTTLNDLMEVYDFAKNHCKTEFSNKQELRWWLEAAYICGAVHILKEKKKIKALSICWPVDKIDHQDPTKLPKLNTQGAILFSLYCYAEPEYREKSKFRPAISGTMAVFLAEYLEEFPQLQMLAYRRTKDLQSRLHLILIGIREEIT